MSWKRNAYNIIEIYYNDAKKRRKSILISIKEFFQLLISFHLFKIPLINDNNNDKMQSLQFYISTRKDKKFCQLILLLYI